MAYADGRTNTNSANYKAGYNAGVAYADGRANSNSANYKAGVTYADGRANTSSTNYKTGYNKGVADADARANTSSTNYKTGYNKGVADADARVNSSSANYKAGYSAGRTQGQSDVKANPGAYGLESGGSYNNGYNAGVAAADGRANSGSANYKAGYNAGYDAGFEKGKRFVLSNHANYIGVAGSNGGEIYSTHDQYNVLSGTKIRFYNMTGGDNKRIIVSTANTGHANGDIYDSGYTYSTDLSFTLGSGGDISITIMSRDGSEQHAWISFENPSY